MPKITIASLERRILVLESEKQTLGGQLSINGEHAACVVDDIRETAWLGDEIVG